MGDSSLGLIFSVRLDPGATEEQIAQLKSSVGSFGGSFTQVNQQVGESLLSSRESTRLLSEELGLHLPRAVTSAISEIIPSIAGMGTALLGVFAVEEVVKFGGALKGLADDFNSTKLAAKFMAEEISGIEGDMKRIAHESVEMAQSQLVLINVMIAQKQKYIDDLLALLKASAEHGGGVTMLIDKMTGKYADLHDQEEKLKKLEESRLGLLEILGEEDKKAHDKAIKGAKDHEKALTELEKSQIKAFNAFAKSVKHWQHAQDEAAKAQRHLTEEVEHFRPILPPLAEEIERLSKAEEKLPIEKLAKQFLGLLPPVANLHLQIPHLSSDLAQFGAQIQPLPANIGNLKRALEDLRAGFSDLSQEEWATASIMKQVGSIIESTTIASIENSLAAVAGMVAGRKAEAAVNAVFYGAEGAVHLAEGIWPPNPALIARGLGELAAAAQFGQLAGSSGGGGAGANYAGSGGGLQSRYGAGGGDISGSRAGSFGGGNYSTTHVINFNSTVVTGSTSLRNFLHELAPMINSEVKGGQLYIVSSNALTNGPKHS